MHSFNYHDYQHCLHQHCCFLHLDSKKAINQEVDKIKSYLSGSKKGLWNETIHPMLMFLGYDFKAKSCHLVYHSLLVLFFSLAANKDCRYCYRAEKSSRAHLLEYSSQVCSKYDIRFLSKHRLSLHLFNFGHSCLENEKYSLTVFNGIKVPH